MLIVKIESPSICSATALFFCLCGFEIVHSKESHFWRRENLEKEIELDEMVN
jgi:hypothetical protein